MPEHIVYEVDLSVAPSVVDAFDQWLTGHVEAVLAQAGFLSAQIQQDEVSDDDGWRRRKVSYRLMNRQALADYLAGSAAALRADGQRRFGDKMRAQRRILTLTREFEAPAH